MAKKASIFISKFYSTKQVEGVFVLPPPENNEDIEKVGPVWCGDYGKSIVAKVYCDDFDSVSEAGKKRALDLIARYHLVENRTMCWKCGKYIASHEIAGMNWVHNVVWENLCGHSRFTGPEPLSKELNKLGEQGWEAVDDDWGGQALLKRQKLNQPGGY